MSFSVMAQVIVDVFLGVGVFVTAMRVAREPKDDPRLSRGLQLLQSKIAILEDLADRSETQAQQLSQLLEQKSRDVQARIEEAERHVAAVRGSIRQSLEVAKIFEDKIPHREIIERRNTAMYVTAARMAHQGRSVDEIAAAVDLPRGELEFIAKVNKDRLMFSEESLPLWASQRPDLDFVPSGAASGAGSGAPDFAPDFSAEPRLEVGSFAEAPAVAYEPPATADAASLESLGEAFRRAQAPPIAPAEPPSEAVHNRRDSASSAAPHPQAEPGSVAPWRPVAVDAPVASVPVKRPEPVVAVPAPPVIRKVEFPRIGISRSVRPTDNLR